MVLILSALSVQVAAAATTTWTGASGLDLLWSTPGNWSGGPPGTNDTAAFDDGGATGDLATVNNLVLADTSILALLFGQTNGFHHTALEPGVTLTLSGTNTGNILFVGTGVDNGAAQTLSAAISGADATLAVRNTNANFNVRQGSSTTGPHRATLDLAGLDTFIAEVSRLLVAGDGSSTAAFNRPGGTLLLANTNTITASGGSASAPAINIADGSSNGGNGVMRLGQTNAIAANTITVGRQKSNGTLNFNPAFTNNPVLYLRGVNDLRVATLAIGDNSGQSGSGSACTGTADFTGGTIDAMLDTVFVGRGQTGNGGGRATGTLTLGSGTFDANTLEIGYQNSVTAVGAVAGTVNVNGGSLLVQNSLRLARFTGSGSLPTATLNVNGGSVTANAIVAGGGTSAITINTATLNLTNAYATAGTPAAPLGTLTLSDATLHLRITDTSSVIVTTALITGGTRNFIAFDALAAFESYPVEIPILKYSGAIGGSGFNFVRGDLPAGFDGDLTDNAANSSVDLILYSGPVALPALTWTGAIDGNWDVGLTANWLAPTGPAAYQETSAVTFDDSATGPKVINLTTSLTPARITVNNASLNYTFTGPGKLSGSASLTKSGAGSLILQNQGTNDFTGPFTINAGTVQVGNATAAGTLGLSGVLNNGAIVFARTDDVVIPNPISGSGPLTQNGTGVLTLSGNNSFTGDATVAQGILKVGAPSALGPGGATTVHPGATLDVNGLSLAGEPVTASGEGVQGQGAIINTGGQITTALRVLTLASDTTFGGTARWDIRNSGGAASLNTGGNAHRITKVGTNQVCLVAVNVDPALGDIDIREGLFSVQTSTTQLGNPVNTITVHSNAALGLYNLNANPLDKNIVLLEGATIRNDNGRSIVNGLITLQGNANFNAGSGGTTPSFSLNGELTGAGNLTKLGSGPLILNNSLNAYSGMTIVSNGTLLVDGGYIESGAFIVYGGTLGGTGQIYAPVFIEPNGTLSPGSLDITIANLSLYGALTLAGTNLMDLTKSAGATANDTLTGIPTLTFGGTLHLNLIGDPLADGDVFALYSFTSANGAFANIVPETPGPGLAWDTTHLTSDGTLRVRAGVTAHLGTPSLTGTNLALSGIGGVPFTPFNILASTNVTLPLTNWVPLAASLFDDRGNFNLSLGINTNDPQRFYILQLP